MSISQGKEGNKMHMDTRVDKEQVIAHTTEDDSAMKKNELVSSAVIQISLEIITGTKVNHNKKVISYDIYCVWKGETVLNELIYI